MNFKYQIPVGTNLELSDSNLCIARGPLGDEVVILNRDENDNPMVLANKSGWLYLAKVCVEMAYASEVDSSFHMHRSVDFGISAKSTDDRIGFFQIARDLEAKMLQTRIHQTKK